MKQEQISPLPPPHVRVISEAEAAARLSLSRRTLQEYRLTGRGPKYVNLGLRRVGYSLTDLDAWVAARTVVSTAAKLGDGA